MFRVENRNHSKINGVSNSYSLKSKSKIDGDNTVYFHPSHTFHNKTVYVNGLTFFYYRLEADKNKTFTLYFVLINEDGKLTTLTDVPIVIQDKQTVTTSITFKKAIALPTSFFVLLENNILEDSTITLEIVE